MQHYIQNTRLLSPDLQVNCQKENLAPGWTDPAACTAAESGKR